MSNVLWCNRNDTENGVQIRLISLEVGSKRSSSDPTCAAIHEAVDNSIEPNTHLRRDSTVELSRVGVGGVNRIRNYLTTTAD